MCWKICVAMGVCVSALFASPVGNPAFPRIIKEGFYIPSDILVSVRAGYEGDFVSDARLNQTIESSGRVDSFVQNINSGTITLNVAERVDFYSILGASQICADWRYEVPQNNTFVVNRAQLETLTQFLWGVGARGILFQTETLTLGIGGRYSFTNPDPVWLLVNAVNQNIAGAKCRWYEWQFDLDFAFQIDLFIPYIGVKYSGVRVKLGHFPEPIAMNAATTNHFEDRIPVGVVLGCSISNGKYFMLNVEARLVNEEAMTISGDLRF
ncbi:MAG: hypothetical protein HY069_01445 [Chlamydiia bacterium]|nr:hypothetical protein [Chlamydiia bacterium]